jgi:hypothetical protein
MGKTRMEAAKYSFYKVKELIAEGALSLYDEDPYEIDDDGVSRITVKRKILI